MKPMSRHRTIQNSRETKLKVSECLAREIKFSVSNYSVHWFKNVAASRAWFSQSVSCEAVIKGTR